MQIDISARHGSLSSKTQDHLREKVEKLRRFHDRLTAIHITVDLDQRETPAVELRVSAERVDDFVATERDELMAAFDQVLHKVEQQLRKHKEKRTGRRLPGIKHLDVGAEQNRPESS